MPQPSNLKTSIFFELPFPDSGWAIRYSWLGEGKIAVDLHWRNKPLPTHMGEISLDDLHTIISAFEALHYNPRKESPLP